MSRRVLMLVALAMTVPSHAFADPFVLRSPSFLNLDSEGNSFAFAADGFSAKQDDESQIGIQFGGTFSGCDPCRRGDTYDPSYSTTNAFLGHGSATVGTTSYSDLALFGDLTFVATPQPFPGTENNGFELSRLSFIFADAAATPEPASMLLLATGLAGLAARKRLTRGSPSR